LSAKGEEMLKEAIVGADLVSALIVLEKIIISYNPETRKFVCLTNGLEYIRILLNIKEYI